MLNYKEIKIGNIFKRGIKLANILDIDQEYAKKNRNDNKKYLILRISSISLVHIMRK